MTLAKGDVVLIPFPFTDLSAAKLRPAVVLWVDPAGEDISLCFISSQNLANISSDEFLLEATEPEFLATGLKTSSKVRVTRIVTIERNLVHRRLGKLQSGYITKLNNAIVEVFQLI